MRGITAFSMGLVTVLGVGVVAAPRASAQEAACQPPRVLIVLDRSSSMTTGRVGKKTKWAVATDALAKLLATHQSRAEFGLMVFPVPDRCGPGKVKVAPRLDNADAIMAKLAAAPPVKGNWTPMAQSLDVAGKVAALQDAARSRHVLLITDGWQWCAPYDESTRFAPVVAVRKLRKAGIRTHVVGFGASVDALALNKMAAAARTKVADGCRDDSKNPKADDNCYYQANDPQQLIAALEQIGHTITAEACDGIDNDCDGLVDEELVGPACNTQVGVCAGAMQPCGGEAGWLACTTADLSQHAWAAGSVHEISETRCDGVDNDCDGTVDEGCACQDGDTRPCGIGTGACAQGVQTCAGGAWGDCAGEVRPDTELCDGVDNDCDGAVDGELALCDDDSQVCVEGTCVTPLTDEGCACSLDGEEAPARAAGALLLTLLLGAAALGATRRRRKEHRG